MGDDLAERMLKLGVDLEAAVALRLFRTPPFYTGPKEPIAIEKTQIVLDRDTYVKELQELRRDIATLHNHKEVVAYSALSLNIAGVSLLATRTSPPISLIIILLIASCLLHFMMRFQLIHRWHCTQFYQIYREAIQNVLKHPKGDMITYIISRSDVMLPKWPDYIDKYIVWTRDEALVPVTYNYPTTQYMDDTIRKYNKAFFEGSRRNSPVEKFPTAASLACVGVIVAYLIHAIFAKTPGDADCVSGLVKDTRSC